MLVVVLMIILFNSIVRSFLAHTYRSPQNGKWLKHFKLLKWKGLLRRKNDGVASQASFLQSAVGPLQRCEPKRTRDSYQSPRDSYHSDFDSYQSPHDRVTTPLIVIEVRVTVITATLIVIKARVTVIMATLIVIKVHCDSYQRP